MPALSGACPERSRRAEGPALSAAEGAASLLAVALERRVWSLAALCLLLGVTEAAARLPPETLEELLDLLEAPGGRRRR